MNLHTFLSLPKRPRGAKTPESFFSALLPAAVLFLPCLLFERWMYYRTSAVFIVRPWHVCLLIFGLLAVPGACARRSPLKKCGKKAAWIIRTAFLLVLCIALYRMGLYTKLRGTALFTIPLKLPLFR